jgi:hypothetical protein
MDLILVLVYSGGFFPFVLTQGQNDKRKIAVIARAVVARSNLLAG